MGTREIIVGISVIENLAKVEPYDLDLDIELV